jgi:hypothetical protein
MKATARAGPGSLLGNSGHTPRVRGPGAGGEAAGVPRDGLIVGRVCMPCFLVVIDDPDGKPLPQALAVYLHLSSKECIFEVRCQARSGADRR